MAYPQLRNMAAQQLGYGSGPQQRPDAAASAAQSRNAFAGANPSMFNKPNVLATFDGKPMAWTGGPALRPGSTMPGGARVMSGTGGTPGGTRPFAPGAAMGATTPNRGVTTPSAGTPLQGGVIPPPKPAAIGGLPADIQKMLDEANAANEKRYGQLLGNADKDKAEQRSYLDAGWKGVMDAQQQGADATNAALGGWNDVLGLVGQQSTAPAIERERRRRETELGQSKQSLSNRGLVNTTVLDSQRRGIQDDSALRTEEIFNNQRQQEIGVRQNMLSQTVPTAMRLGEQRQGILQNQVGQTGAMIERSNADRQGLIERRSDEGPNLALWAQTLQQQGASRTAADQAAQASRDQQNQSAQQYQNLLSQILGRMPQQFAGGPGGANGRNRTGGFQRPPQTQGGAFPGGQQPGGRPPRETYNPGPTTDTQFYGDPAGPAGGGENPWWNWGGENAGGAAAGGEDLSWMDDPYYTTPQSRVGPGGLVGSGGDEGVSIGGQYDPRQAAPLNPWWNSFG